MSPRSEEFMVQARDRAVAAKELLAAGHLEPAVSVAYYAMLNAARAALSEDDQHSRTHRGTWHLFRERYVVTDAFDEKLYTLAINAQGARERGDYEAVTPSSAEAKEIVDGVDTFVVAVEHMLGT
ncbi:MAG: HEPN domain-containing protein [Solirubrobacterales bacterium]